MGEGLTPLQRCSRYILRPLVADWANLIINFLFFKKICSIEKIFNLHQKYQKIYSHLCIQCIYLSIYMCLCVCLCLCLCLYIYTYIYIYIYICIYIQVRGSSMLKGLKKISFQNFFHKYKLCLVWN